MVLLLSLLTSTMPPSNEDVKRVVINFGSRVDCLYSPSCREGFFWENGLPLNDVLGNSGARRAKEEGKRAGALLPALLKHPGTVIRSPHSLVEPLANRLGPLKHGTCRYQRLCLNLY